MEPSVEYNSGETKESRPTEVCQPCEMAPSEFLTALWGNPPPGMVNVFVLPERESHWYREFSNIDRDLEKLAHKEVYTCVALAARKGGHFTKNNRIEEAKAAAIPGLWADIDVAHPVHKKHEQLPPSAERAMEVMAQLPYEPTLIVDSGHGLQYWWCFQKPWVFADQEEWAQARRVTQWWHQLIKDLFASEDWTTDSVFDLSRIMRVPGTWNNKDSGDRKQVTVVKDDGPRYVVTDFAKLIPEDFVASPPVAKLGITRGSRNGKQRRESKGSTAAPSRLVLRADAEPGSVRLEALLKAHPRFKLTWERARPDLTDQSASCYDMAIAGITLRAGWPDQEVVNGMISWRRMHDEDLKLREEYYDLTLAKAKAKKAGEKTSNHQNVNSTTMDSPREEPAGGSGSYPEEQRRKVILLNDEGLNIAACVHAVQISNNPPTLFSVSDGGSIGVLSHDQGMTGMEICTSDDTHLEIARRVHFVKWDKKGAESAAVPPVTLMNLVHRALRRELPRFDGFKRLPFLWDGALVTSPGYHPESGYYVDLPAGLDLSLSAESALMIIDEFFGEFPFQGPADKANAYSMILGFPLKSVGIAPGLFVDKPVSQTGASLLSQCLGWVIEGRTPAIVTQGRSMGELDKRMITKLRDHPGVIIFDNLTAVLDSDMAVSGMTDEWFGGRLLGSNKDALVPTRSLALMFTGNNVTATRDLLNRCLRCRLDANHPNPEMRTHFRHHLPGDVVDNRAMLVSAVSSIVQRWIEDGMPQGASVLGRFIEYTQAVAGLMTFVGIPHFDTNRRKMLTDSTPSWENLDGLVLRWWDKCGPDPVQSIDLVELAEELDLKGADERSRATSLSRRLGSALGQVFEVDGGVHVKLLESGRDEKGRAKRGLRYRLMELKPGS